MARDFLDELETRDPEVREREQFETLRNILRHAIDASAAWKKRLTGVAPETIRDRKALADLPVLRKSEFVELQKKNPPLGGLATREPGEFIHLFTSPGPIHEPGGEGDFGRMARSMHAAGFRKGDVVHNTFSYHFTPAGFMMEQGARALGCAVIPAGTGNTDLQLDTIAAIRPNRYVGTPSFLVILLETGKERGIDVSSIKTGIVGGEALTPSLLKRIEGHGVKVLQGYGTADVGQIAYETVSGEGMILDEDVIVEIVEPGGVQPIGPDETGEVVVTSLNPDYPLIRFATGDLSRFMEGASPCGRTARRIAGWLGRANQATKVRGLFVHPAQVDRIAKRHPELARIRLVIGSKNDQDTLFLRCEAEGGEDLAQALATSAREVLRLRANVEFAPQGTLPDDGTLIEDTRSHG